MAQVTAKMVKELRDMTGAGMMDCKKALVEADGDLDKAVVVLREKGLSKAIDKSGRVAAEGLVRTAFSADHKEAAVIEVNSETDFVSKNPEFIGFVEALAERALKQDKTDMDAFLASSFEGEKTVKDALTEKIATIGENMNIRRYAKLESPGVVYTGYVHGGGRIGVIVGIETEASEEEINTVAKDVAMQVASMNPEFLDEDSVDQAWLENEKEIARQQFLNEGKKPEVVDKIMPGKIKSILKETCLVDQKFVKDSDITVSEYVEAEAKKLGKGMKIVEMVRYEVGEGLEKKNEDFAAEVASQINKK